MVFFVEVCAETAAFKSLPGPVFGEGIFYRR